MNATYNGWTNYATWRINHELFDGFDPVEYWGKDCLDSIYELGQSLKCYAEELLFDCGEQPQNLVADYARAFLDEVNWYEIADHIAKEVAE
jgi:hypothetical protein